MNSLEQHKPLLLQQSEWMYKVRQTLIDLQRIPFLIFVIFTISMLIHLVGY